MVFTLLQARKGFAHLTKQDLRQGSGCGGKYLATCILVANLDDTSSLRSAKKTDRSATCRATCDRAIRVGRVRSHRSRRARATSGCSTSRTRPRRSRSASSARRGHARRLRRPGGGRSTTPRWHPQARHFDPVRCARARVVRAAAAGRSVRSLAGDGVGLGGGRRTGSSGRLRRQFRPLDPDSLSSGPGGRILSPRGGARETPASRSRAAPETRSGRPSPRRRSECHRSRSIAKHRRPRWRPET